MDLIPGKMGNGMELNVNSVNNLQDTLSHTVTGLSELHPLRSLVTDIKIEGAINCDPQRIAQLLSNLLINAIVHGDHAQIINVKAIFESGTFTLRVINGGRRLALIQ